MTDKKALFHNEFDKPHETLICTRSAGSETTLDMVAGPFSPLAGEDLNRQGAKN
jgi:hypothetical protein